MPDPNLVSLVEQVDQWETEKRSLAGPFTNDGLRQFTETMNYRSRTLVQLCGRKDPDFWTSLAELATQAATLTTPGAKLFVNKQDRTNL